MVCQEIYHIYNQIANSLFPKGAVRPKIDKICSTWLQNGVSRFLYLYGFRGKVTTAL